MSWQAELFQRLRDREWHRLGDLFEAFQHRIPLHFAMRHVMQPCYGRTELPANSEARWRCFLTNIANVGIESTGAGNRRKYTDMVRLKYVAGRRCGACGGPVIRASFSARERVACLACEARTRRPAPAVAQEPPSHRPRQVTIPPSFAAQQPERAALTIVRTSPGWQWRARRAFAEFVKKTRLPGLSVSRIVRELEKYHWNPARFLASRGKRPMTQQEHDRWWTEYLFRHPP